VVLTALKNIRSAATEPACMPQTPSQWLLARYDRLVRRTFGPQGDGRRIRHVRGSNFDRRIFDLIDDHPGADCEQDDDGDCAYQSGEASWPMAALGENLDPDVPLEIFQQIA
jgi:hypothetical protein